MWVMADTHQAQFEPLLFALEKQENGKVSVRGDVGTLCQLFSNMYARHDAMIVELRANILKSYCFLANKNVVQGRFPVIR